MDAERSDTPSGVRLFFSDGTHRYPGPKDDPTERVRMGRGERRRPRQRFTSQLSFDLSTRWFDTPSDLDIIEMSGRSSDSRVDSGTLLDDVSGAIGKAGSHDDEATAPVSLRLRADSTGRRC